MATKTAARTKARAQTKAANDAPVFSKEQLVRSKTYRDYRDALSVVLKDGEYYSHEQVKALLDEFLNTPIVEQVNKKEA